MVEQIYEHLNITDNYQLPDKLMDTLLDPVKNEELFRSLEYTEEDLYEDAFYIHFQEEHAERKKFKQDFTPRQLTKLVTNLATQENDNYIYEPAAGTGGMIIEHWGNNKHRKDEIFYAAEEISSRAVPILLFNLAIRGISGVVLHVDSLMRTSKGVFLLDGQNKSYSSIKVMPYSLAVEEEFNITFTEQPYQEYINWHSRVSDIFERYGRKTTITEIEYDDLDNYEYITVVSEKGLQDIVTKKEEIKGEIIEIRELKNKGTIGQVVIE